ncbi:hypothetical protein CRV02_12975 [Arcobacter sp. CECT 8989]|uniref:hypothetical protein n=1 Tax=Arcobacter sp. CECT 8989 TaxID=2044509 RepID=UPI00100BD817|nr:hypothetical protein [Arcobacter sp. CECT 8989]RXJ98658.1 hypothetical protein CRV02_12975 [Arcobacter sp. CECT 8989]
MIKILTILIITNSFLFSTQSVNYKNSLDLYKSISTQLNAECTELIKGSNNQPILMKSIQNTFWKAKSPDTIISPINNQSFLETFHKLDILYCKKALEKYKISKNINDNILKNLTTNVYFFEEYIEVLEESENK